MPNCFYCSKDDRLSRIMIPICELQATDVYLFRDQLYQGRCVVALKEHKREWFELSRQSLHDFADEVAIVAKALQLAYHPDKLNYAVYGDVVDHFHLHLVPKYRDGFGWSRPFQTDSEHSIELQPSEYEQMREEIMRQIQQTERGRTSCS